MEIKFNISNEEYKNLISYCNLNDLLVSEIVKKSYITGYNIERYGLLNVNQDVKEKEVIKEIIKYVEIPVIEEKEVIRIEYIEVEKEVEVIKEVPSPPVEIEVIKYIEKEVIKEIIKEVPTPPTEIKVIEYVDREVVKEVIKEVFVPNIDKIWDEPEPEIREVIVEKIVEIIKEVEVEKIVEVIKEVEVEKIVEVIKEVIIDSDIDKLNRSKLDALQQTVQKLRQETLDKDKQIKELEKTVVDIQKFQDNTKAIYLSGSNLDKPMYK